MEENIDASEKRERKEDLGGISGKDKYLEREGEKCKDSKREKGFRKNWE